jgi:site-specific DNA recombinase
MVTHTLRVLTVGARERGYTIYDHYVDAGISGEVRDRPALLRLLDDAAEGRFTVVLATELARLTRGGLADYYYLKSELGRCGVRLEFLSGSDYVDDGNEVAPLFEAIEAVRPLIEKRAITRRFQSGRLRVWNEDKFHWASAAPYGYKYTGGGRKLGHWEVVPEEAEIIRRIFRWAAEGVSLHEIAKRLNRAGVPTQRGGRWWASTLSGIIANPRYKGVFASCRYKAVVPKGPYRPRAVASKATGQPGQVRIRPKTALRLRPESEWQGKSYNVTLALVDADLWARANAMRPRNEEDGA